MKRGKTQTGEPEPKGLLLMGWKEGRKGDYVQQQPLGLKRMAMISNMHLSSPLVGKLPMATFRVSRSFRIIIFIKGVWAARVFGPRYSMVHRVFVNEIRQIDDEMT
jgi:hypothetical protein